MAITQAVCNSFKTQLLQGMHNFTVLTGTNTVSSVAAAAGTSGPNGTATTVYTGTFTNGGSDAYAGLVLCLTGFGTASNNGTYLCLGSSTTTITLANPNGANSGAMGTVNTTTDVFAIALAANNSQTLGAGTTTFSALTECTTSGTYTTGGIGSLASSGTLVGNAMALVSTTPVLSTSTACCLFATISWTTATITAYGAIIYNASLGTTKAAMPVCVVLNFGSA